MATRNDDRSRREQDERNTDIRRETQVRGSMGKPASGRESEIPGDREEIQGSGSESRRPPRQPGRMPLPD